MTDDNPGTPAKGGHPRSTTTVGPTITIRGKLRSGEDLIVKGRIDAEITSSKALFLENSGVVRANMNVASARISGVQLGDVTAEEKIEIASDGRMIGDLLAPRIVIQDGAAFRGRIDMPNFDDAGGGRSSGRELGSPASPPAALPGVGFASASAAQLPAAGHADEPTLSDAGSPGDAGDAAGAAGAGHAASGDRGFFGADDADDEDDQDDQRPF